MQKLWMEILSCDAGSCCYIVNIRRKVVKKSPSLHQLKLPRETRFFSVPIKSDSKCLQYSHPHHYSFRKLNNSQPSRTVVVLKRDEHINSRVSGETYSSFVLDGEEGVNNVTGRGKSVSMVLIPSLPDESNGDYVAPISSSSSEWKPKLTVHYEKSGSENVDSPPLLFLPGFGVGSFHYEKQLKDLGRDFRAWAIDFLGQGMSLPCEDPTFGSNGGDKLESDRQDIIWGFGDETETWAEELVYSVDLWRDQVSYFIEEVIKEPVYLVGNSLGGFVAIYFAACYPQLVKGVTLLNATPFWGFFPNPVRYPRLSRLFPWAGTFPLPSIVRKLTEILWQKISNPRSIEQILDQVYVDHATKVDKVFSRIIETTQHPAAAASFASILFAPQGQLSFNEALSRCRMNNLPICLLYGKEDPWVKPIWGLQVKRQVPEAPYYEISPAGHCPHDEVPEVVNFLLRGWIQYLESQGSIALPLLDTPQSVRYDFAWDLEFIREGSRKSTRVKFLMPSFSIWNRLISRFKSGFENCGTDSQ
ncbi:pheophytinase, chloroplastic-like isoform X1 [Olea europaea var. sylvestris]|uniref:pheophytinase, chloroplastic-like isoform X1 n=1 Tax=Olea europaea var. sylvestris TaxID=158386 RepID=UPI000C1CCE81|nr:pheophytinase, chloroplastic-like isoform X1 [Olea europaea var. sylvestris]XP_022876639.1 pheophytinase, chloroplastic-like isoform X1 [Olea europaea var. sylvestris]